MPPPPPSFILLPSFYRRCKQAARLWMETPVHVISMQKAEVAARPLFRYHILKKNRTSETCQKGETKANSGVQGAYLHTHLNLLRRKCMEIWHASDQSESGRDKSCRSRVYRLMLWPKENRIVFLWQLLQGRLSAELSPQTLSPPPSFWLYICSAFQSHANHNLTSFCEIASPRVRISGSGEEASFGACCFCISARWVYHFHESLDRLLFTICMLAYVREDERKWESKQEFASAWIEPKTELGKTKQTLSIFAILTSLMASFSPIFPLIIWPPWLETFFCG